ncbi:phenylacetic acid degradation operon negative regulatory protein PaaX [Aromatoleum aromaticum]|uniref:PadR protein, putative regulator of anaerobic phenylacetate metabolism n=1 Tax=Aromatoleum aromaticum (strain DSM 19018 / LMG 30748 / EbN1) TaxID=76114 RepID=Q5P0I2_AROAE|nr:phenylacetic acid degradation operon negative regulatory protein PaaX [Aromatoleum aromaticum]NMG53845.1 phenylacetic acid degradation operon negative regulatory protein PaaX [Aromatoleum aromaticum]CAI09182.1 PadR protein, putative regulator of anaerobic phenylacetate metabolism [Aromatoleum aromaticum EbN1]
MKSRFITQWINDYLAERRVRANSLIITIYGDFIAPHGGTVWLGSFIRLVEPLGLNERMVRTSVYRLSQDKWLVSEQIGRKSYYSLTASGRRRFEHAYRRIYDARQLPWNGEWQLVILPSTLPAPQRDALRKELSWAGYGTIAPCVLAHPSADTETLLEILQETGTHDKVVPMTAHNLGALSNRPLQDLARECWNLEAIGATYREFADRLRPVLRALRTARDLDPEQCFLVQTLTMHDFRRALLHDPLLPDQLMPVDWSGAVAREVCRDIYRITYRLAQQHLMATCKTPNGPLPPAAPYFYERFGGLEDTTHREAAEQQ